MSNQTEPVHLVVMGVSGTGKSTVAVALHERLGWEFGEGDDYHPQSNLDKMSAGHPLTDADRWPWLEALAGWTRDRHERGESTILTCSALRRSYRDLLRGGAPGTLFVHLTGARDLLVQRMAGREHFMPVSLLDTQLDTLEELDPDEAGLAADVAQPPEDIAENVVRYVQPPVTATTESAARR